MGEREFILSKVPLSNEGATIHDRELAMGWAAWRVSRHLAKEKLRSDREKIEEINKAE